MGSEVTPPCIQDDAHQAMGVPPIIQCLPHERLERLRVPRTQAMRAYGLMPGAARRAPAQCARRVHAHVRCMSCTTDNLRNWVLDKITTLAGSETERRHSRPVSRKSSAFNTGRSKFSELMTAVPSRPGTRRQWIQPPQGLGCVGSPLALFYIREACPERRINSRQPDARTITPLFSSAATAR